MKKKQKLERWLEDESSIIVIVDCAVASGVDEVIEVVVIDWDDDAVSCGPISSYISRLQYMTFDRTSNSCRVVE